MFNKTFHLKTKMLLLFIPAIIIVMIAIGVITSKLTENALIENFESSLAIMTSIASNVVETGLEFDDEDAVIEAVGGFTKQKLLSFMRVTNSNGDAVFSYRKEGHKPIDKFDIKYFRSIENEKFKILDVVSGGTKIGTMTIGLSIAETNNTLASTRNAIILTTLITLVIFIGITLFMANKISNPIIKISDIAAKIALGDTNQEIDIQSNDEIGQLANSFHELIEAQKKKAYVADEISKGNFSVDIEILSENDILGKAMMAVKKSIQKLVKDVGTFIGVAYAGDFSERPNISTYKGEYSAIIDGINSILDAVIRPINEAVDVLEKVAAKNLTVNMVGSYAGEYAKIKESLNLAIDNLNITLQQVSNGSEQVNSASNQISSGGQNLAQAASEQASSLEEISSSLKEMSTIIKSNNSNTKEAQTMSESALSASTNGMDSMKHLSEVINKIKQSSDETAKVVKTIDDIAFQTNLLALNAAVEAARAGEAGKGFAVVADEVRNLAMRSADAAKDSAELIDDSVKNAEEGVTVNNNVYKSLEVITKHVQQVNEVMSEIASSSENQAQGIDQIDAAIDQLNQLTQQNAANSEESASTAKELSSQATKMQDMVVSFQLANPTVLNKSLQESSSLNNDAPVPVREESGFSDDNILTEF